MTCNFSFSVSNIRMTLDLNSLQQIIHDAPLWAQYAAQGLAAEAATGAVTPTSSI